MSAKKRPKTDAQANQNQKSSEKKKKPAPPTLAELTHAFKSIKDRAGKEADYIWVLHVTAYLDQMLAMLLRFQFREGNTTENILGHEGILGTLSARAKLCYCLNSIDKSTFCNFMKIAEIRNSFAHSFVQIDFNDAAIQSLCAELDVNPPSYFDKNKIPKDFDPTNCTSQMRFMLACSWCNNDIVNRMLSLAKKQPEELDGGKSLGER